MQLLIPCIKHGFMKIDSILYPEGKTLPSISPCDHYAGSEKLIIKSFEAQKKLNGAFDITCDLEDGALVGDEVKLRKTVCELVTSSLNTHKRTGIRVHDFTSPHFEDDVNEVLRSTGHVISHITVPKITGFLQAKEILQYIKKASSDAKLPKPILAHLLVETHGAVHDIWEIAALPGLRGLDFGLMDFISSHHGAISDHYMHSPGQFEHALVVRAKTALTAACLAHGIIPAHNVTPEFTDSERAFDDALRARTQFGFLRMWSIHPNQIEAILSAFTPDTNEVNNACEIILGAVAASWAPTRHNDRLHDRASYRYYWNLLKQSRNLNLTLPSEILRLFEN